MTSAPTAPADTRPSQGSELSAQLGKQLKQTLQSAMADGGPVAAIDVCQLQAPAIAATIATPGIHVGRTALRVRNSNNAPDPAQIKILQDFERRLSAGESAETIEQFDSADDGSARYMKAIVTQPLCTTCHGTELPPEIAAAITQRYPNDAAVGFAPGSLRGAFVVEWSSSQ
ncbi:DUF3365 domain-containing protein [Sinimarinibacterium sp. CAU 1509]|nr:DUF3365 domain-containing protein [Sinimarinibacterium sp. CAU 1509]